jgi:hypothetical protein
MTSSQRRTQRGRDNGIKECCKLGVHATGIDIIDGLQVPCFCDAGGKRRDGKFMKWWNVRFDTVLTCEVDRGIIVLVL